ncbi:winged helix-turn-helix domain-containing protein [Hyperthermus butylicus]|uniref:Conserved crenarchaeal protein n=1 Tax=Hyperthermus butylicus (strain DSM 5456 / JCM 9403 / PLM1-5) TaxID=415426 RepID=A2BL95_HYPBU|nr:winged helix-turn-helix domain-containing protein [Hyperthermus butylicus]ABM80756.1 conserved crenarchaeal protein [Hyperthermus butylicus DSM 5456]
MHENEQPYFLEIISSRGKLRILLVLLRNGQVNITRLLRETRLHYNLLIKHLEELKAAGIVEETRVGRARLYSLKLNNPRTLVLVETLRLLGESL